MQPSSETPSPKFPARKAAGKKPSNGTEAARKMHARTKVTNGTQILPGIVDTRSVLGRRYRDVLHAVVSDAGGFDHCSEIKLQLARRFTAASLLAERLETDFVNGEAKEDLVTEFSSLCSALVRLATRIGIERVAKEVLPSSLASYLDSVDNNRSIDDSGSDNIDREET